MTHKYSRRFLDIIMNEFKTKTFSITFMEHTKGFVHKHLEKGVSFHYTVPETLCRTHIVNGQKQKPQFSAAAAMALFDEISSYSVAMKDRKMSPGLTVHLDTEMLRDIYAGDNITILTSADKIGSALGFASLEILNDNGELVARGKHIKHLPLGWWFQLITHPIIAPLSLALHEYKVKKETKRKQRAGHNDVKHLTGLHRIEGIGKVFDMLGMKRYSGTVASRMEVDNTAYCSDTGRIDQEEMKRYELTVKQITSNLRKTMHGGAVGCAVEHACLLSRCMNTQEDGSQEGREGVYDLPCYVRALEVRYLAPMKGDLVVTVANDPHSPLLYSDSSSNHSSKNTSSSDTGSDGVSRPSTEEVQRWGNRSIGKVVNQADGSVCAEYVCHWALH